MPCVTIATTSRAPCAITVSAAFANVPHVSAMSSTRRAILSCTSPTSTIRETSLGRGRSLWIRANWRSRRSAMEVALWSGEDFVSLGGFCVDRFLGRRIVFGGGFCWEIL